MFGNVGGSGGGGGGFGFVVCEAESRYCLGYFRIVVQCRLIDRDTIRPNNKAPSVPPRPLCINLSAR